MIVCSGKHHTHESLFHLVRTHVCVTIFVLLRSEREAVPYSILHPIRILWRVLQVIFYYVGTHR